MLMQNGLKLLSRTIDCTGFCMSNTINVLYLEKKEEKREGKLYQIL